MSSSRPDDQTQKQTVDHGQIRDAQMRKDMETLLNAAMSVAGDELKRRGEFGPYAVTMDASGEVTQEPEPEGRIPAEELLERLREAVAVRARRGEVRAVAVGLNVGMRQKREGFRDAVRLEMEHRGGYALEVFVPYGVVKAGLLRRRRVHFGNIVVSRTVEGNPQVFKN
jgi:hypothetical protein